MPARRSSLTIESAGLAASASSRSVVSPSRSLLQPLLHRPTTPVLLDERRGGDALEQAEQLLEGVVALGAAVVDQVEADLELALGDLRQRHDARRMDDGRVEPRLHALV
jgi:hypothetical protein